MRKMLLAVSVCLCAFAIQAAQLEEIIVTGARIPIEAGKLPAAVTVFDREDIEQRQVSSLPELLRGVPGLDVTGSGGYGKVAEVRMRGTESDHVLVLVDGVRVGSATAGLAAFQHLPPSLIERIEIVRGPRASLWGSEALGGVIHIFTRKGSDGPARFSVDASAGSYDTFEVTGSVSGGYQGLDYSATVSRFDTRGIDARQPVPGRFGVDQPDKDGYDNTSGHFRAGYDFGDSGRLEAFFMRAEGETEYDGNFQNETDFLQQVAGGLLSFSPVEDWHTSLRLSEALDEADNFAPSGNFSSSFDTRRRQLSWQNNISLLTDHTLIFGVDYRQQKVGGLTDYTLKSRDNTGVFGQYAMNLHGHQLIASLRWDDFKALGSKTTGSVGWSYVWRESLRGYASFGTAYKAPNFNELFWPDFGNPALQPETSESWEVGLEGRRQWLGWSVRGYRTDVEGLIITVFDGVSFAPQNVAEAQITGVETEFTVQWDSWNALLAAEYLDPEDKVTGNRLARRAKQRLSFDLRRELDRFTFGGRVLAEGARFDNTGNTIRVNGFVTVDLSGEYRVNKHLSLRAKLANLLDKSYQTSNTYNSFERNFLVSLHYRSR